MRLFRPFLIALLTAFPGLAQVPAPQVPLTGNIGCNGFPCLNSGTFQIPTDANYTVTVASGAGGYNTSAISVKITSAGSLTATRNVIYPAGRFFLNVENATTGGQAIQIIGASGTGVTIANGATVSVWNDGTNFVQVGAAGGGATIAHTTNVIVGDGTGNGVASSIQATASSTSHGISLPASSAPITPVSATAIYESDSSGNAVISENGGAAARVCDSTNNSTVCPGAVSSLTTSGSSGPATLSAGVLNVPVYTGGSGTTGLCALADANNLCLTNAPFYAYPAPATLVVGSFSAGTTGTVASCSGITSGSAVLIDGAGASGAEYLGKVSSCSGTALTLATGTSMEVTGGKVTLAGTTTTGTFAVGTSGSVSSCSTFATGNGVRIPGAGSSGGSYLGTVVSCSGTTLTVNPTTSTSVAANSVVEHDETAAIIAGFTALQATGVGGYLLLPCPNPSNVYLANGPLLDTSGANAVLPVPRIANYGPSLINVGIKGCTRHNIFGNGPSILQSEIMTGNLIGGYDADTGGGYAPFTNVALMVEDLTISLPSNTGAVAVNATAILNFPSAKRLLVRTVAASTPSTTTGGGLYMPAILNAVEETVDDVTIAGFGNNLKATEHTHIGRADLESGINCLVLDNGTNTNDAHGSIGYNGNGTEADHIYFGTCTNPIAGGSGPYHSAFYIALADMEQTTGHGILDASDILYGIVNINITDSRGSTSPCNANISGATHIGVHYINCQPESNVPINQGLIEEWAAHEGSGTTLANSGTDSTNSMTMSNVPWATSSGFTGNQPTYNGLMTGTSVSTAASAAQTSFSGYTPFSVCAWHNPTTYTGFGQMFTVDNVSTALGWGIGEFGSTIGGFQGAMFFNLFSSGSNLISVHSPGGAVVSGQPNLECVTYSGSGHASGVTLYVNGVPQAPTVQSDNLTTSAAATLPASIGSNQPSNSAPTNGAIGKVEIWNRQISGADVSNLYALGPGTIE